MHGHMDVKMNFAVWKVPRIRSFVLVRAARRWSTGDMVILIEEKSKYSEKTVALSLGIETGPPR